MAGLKIFITGATGFIGGNFLDKLIKKIDADDTVYALCRKSKIFADGRIKCIVGSLEEIDNCQNELMDCDYVFHLAANATFGNGADYDKDNFLPTKKLVDILKKSAKLKNFIFTSTIGAYDREKKDDCFHPITTKSLPSPTSVYGRSKLKSEQHIRESGIPHTIIRPTWVYGKNMRANSHINAFVTMAYAKSPIFRLAFPGKISLIHVDDLSESLVNSIGNADITNKEYFGVTETQSLGEILKIVFEATTNKKISQVKLPSFRFFFARIHKFIPLTISNLFINYLVARDDDFKKDFHLAETKNIRGSIMDVVDTNMNNGGYWVITGANSGIGYALARILDEKDKKLFLVDKETDNLEKFGRHIVVKSDLSEIENLYRLAAHLDEIRIFRLINNAGIGYKKDFIDSSPADFLKMINVNIVAPVILTRLLLGNIMKNEGTVVNVGSSAGYNPLPGMSIYAASKSFLINWSSSIWFELRGKCNIVTFSPSGTNSNFQKNAGVGGDSKSLLTPDFVAQKIVNSIEKNKFFVFLGMKNKLVAYVTKLLPSKISVIFWGEAFKKLR